MINRQLILVSVVLVIIGFSALFFYGTQPPSEPDQLPSPESEEQTPDEEAGADTAYDLSYLANMDPAEVDNSDLPVTPTDKIHLTGSASRVNISEYRLNIEGLVDNELSLTYEDVLKYPSTTKVVLLICPSVFADNAEWTGVPVATLLSEAGVKPEATEVIFYSIDGYQASFSLQEALSDGVFLAYKVNGQTLPVEHGYPLRLVAAGSYGFNWVKWLNRIVVR